MPRPILLKQVLKILKENRFFFITQKGSHGKFRKVGAHNGRRTLEKYLN